MVSIKQMIVSDNLATRVTYGGTNKKQYITVHQTGNTSKGANAGAHARLQANGNSRSASWHYQVDDKEIIQSFSDNAQCWHAGDGRGTGNLNSIGIELCINSDADYKKTLENGAELVRHLMAKYNIPINNVKQHNHWSGKNCPAQIRAGKEGIDWNDFLNMVSGGQKVAAAPKTKVKTHTISSSSTGANLTVDGKWAELTTRALQDFFGTPVDGVLSGQSQNSVTNALYGNTARFGSGGSLVIKALQRYLNSKGFKLKVDGLLGPATIRALQSYLGTPVDGVLSRPSLVVKEMQKRLNKGTF